jgi:hypothetical protein
MYKYKAIVERIRDVLIPYEPSLEAMCDIATGLLKELVPGIQIFAGKVFDNRRNHYYPHVWAYDTNEHYYIDITSEQFGLPPCLCSPDESEFEKNGYEITCNFHEWNDAFENLAALKTGPVLNVDKQFITFDHLLLEIKPKEEKKKSKGWFFGGTRRKRSGIRS